MKKLFLIILLFGFSCIGNEQVNPEIDLEKPCSIDVCGCSEGELSVFDFDLTQYPADESYLNVGYYNTWKVKHSSPWSACPGDQHYMRFYVAVPPNYQGDYPNLLKINGVTKYLSSSNKSVYIRIPIYNYQLNNSQHEWTFTVYISMDRHECTELWAMGPHLERPGATAYGKIGSGSPDYYDGTHYAKGVLAQNCD